MIPFESDNLRAYTLLLRIEIALRELLRIALESEFGVQWRKRLPGDLLKKIKESQAEENRPQFGYPELKANHLLSAEEKAKIVSELTVGYRTLFEAGITEIDNCIRLAGAPLSAGFWKSYVEVEKGKRWSWNDDSFAEQLRKPILLTIGNACGVNGYFETHNGDNAKQALNNLRAGVPVKDVDESMGEMIFTAVVAREAKVTHAVDVSFQWDSPAGRQSTQARFLEESDSEMAQKEIIKWLEAHKHILAANEIVVSVNGFERWELPSADELHRLGYISGYRIPDSFGPPQAEQAVSKFGQGDVQGSMNLFARMLADKDEAQIRNNLAFCQIVTGDYAGGLQNATKAVDGEYEPLFELNKGIASFLQGDAVGAKQCLHNALKELRENRDKYFSDAAYLLVLAPDLKTTGAQPDLLVEVAILINLWRIGDVPRGELEAELTRLMSEKAKPLLDLLGSTH